MKQLLSQRENSLLILILMIGVFGIINTEMGMVGILPLIAETFKVSIPDAGWTVSIFALVVAFSGPITPLLFSKINRKTVMLLTLGIFVISNIVSMFTTNFIIILIARAIPAFFHPIYVSMAFTIAASSSNKKEAPKAVSKIFIGVSSGMVLGVPLTSFIANESSFSNAMLFFTFINAAVLLATIIYVPSMPVTTKVSYGEQLSTLKKSITWYSIIAVTLLNGAIFGFFSFMSDYLKNITGLSFKMISIALFIYGAANIIGNIIAGKLLIKNASRTIKIIPFALGIAYILLFTMGGLTIPTILIILILGIFAGIASNNNQYMLTDASPEAPDFANGLFLTSANLGTAIGTFICGLFITKMGTHNVIFGAITFLSIGILFVFLRNRIKTRN